MVTVKICGITNSEDALVAVEAGADFLGFICYAKSPRFVPPEGIRAVVRAVKAAASASRRASVAAGVGPGSRLGGGISINPPRVPRFVGVFVNAPVADVRHVLDFCGLDYAQLHGDEPVDDLPAIGGRGYKAIRPNTRERAFTDAALYAPLARHHGPHLLIDAYDPGAFGGTGQRTDWELAARLALETRHLLLAGGLTPANVTEAVRAVRPWGVDVSSGVEAAPGRKDHDKVRVFVAAAKAA
jgi:phosphoribosylanthranilate isomerase